MIRRTALLGQALAAGLKHRRTSIFNDVYFRRLSVSASLAEDQGDSFTFPREGEGISYGLNWGLASRKVFPQNEAYRNLKAEDLQKHGAKSSESISRVPLFSRGNASMGTSDISKPQFSRLLKEVRSHLSSTPKVYVHDGAVGSSSKFDAKVRCICDDASAASAISRVLCRTPTRDVSYDAYPLTVYIAADISPSAWECVGLGPKEHGGFIAADYEQSAIILCGKAYMDRPGVEGILSAAAAQAISARNALPLYARLLVHKEHVVMLFATDSMVQRFQTLEKFMASTEPGVALHSDGVGMLFQGDDSKAPSLFKLPSSIVMLVADSSGAIPPITKLTPGQAAYHFLSGYENGNFVPAYTSGPLSIDPLVTAKELNSQLKNNNVSTFMLNVSDGEKLQSGEQLLKWIEATVSGNLPKHPKKSETSVDGLKSKYAQYLSGRFPELPEDFEF
eukprot:TRINITY_DN1673_c0_g1_i1.p1 TRINITY_DN1673_c0_g1~~TRINITY_DN1673_c0_g1_i1.p1  ORF type:complete len:449 (-),score=94.92 TRINITY_DN1673_c0_g1_i1:76-1422(-)